MAEQDMITMSRREAARLHSLHQAVERRMTQREAARLVGLSDRQVRRLIQRVRAEGETGICHRARGQASNHRIPERVKARALTLCRAQYSDFNLVHATEKLGEVHGIPIHAEIITIAGESYRRREAEAAQKARRGKP